MGRFASEDPIQISGLTTRLYVYVENSSLNYFDPSGMKPGDKLFGLPREFWNWYHANEKYKGRPDLPTRAEALDEFNEWKRQLRPGPDNKGKFRKGRGPRLRCFGFAIEGLFFLYDLNDTWERAKESEKTFNEQNEEDIKTSPFWCPFGIPQPNPYYGLDSNMI